MLEIFGDAEYQRAIVGELDGFTITSSYLQKHNVSNEREQFLLNDFTVKLDTAIKDKIGDKNQITVKGKLIKTKRIRNWFNNIDKAALLKKQMWLFDNFNVYIPSPIFLKK